MTRKRIGPEKITQAFNELDEHATNVLARKGYGSFASSHEALGVIEDEHNELINAISCKQGLPAVKHELLDIAAACLFAVACIDASTLDW